MTTTTQTDRQRLAKIIIDNFERNDRREIRVPWERQSRDIAIGGEHGEADDGEVADIEFDDHIIVTIPAGFGQFSIADLCVVADDSARKIADSILADCPGADSAEWEIESASIDSEPSIDFDNMKISFPLAFKATLRKE